MTYLLTLRGSYLYGTHMVDSDIDLLHVVKPPIGDLLMGGVDDYERYDEPFDVKQVTLQCFLKDLKEGFHYAAEAVFADPIVGHNDNLKAFLPSSLNTGMFTSTRLDDDNKRQYHGIRHALQCIQYMEEGELTFPLDDQAGLRDIRKHGLSADTFDNLKGRLSEATPRERTPDDIMTFIKEVYLGSVS